MGWLGNIIKKIPLAGDIYAETEAEDDREKAQAQMQAELDARRGKMPGRADLQTQYALGDPNAYLLGDSQAAGAQADGQAIAGQGDALSALQNVYQNQGMTDADRAYMQQAQAQNARALGANNAATMQSFQERGMGGSGAGLAAQLSNQSQLANANAGMAANVNFAAQDRALSAMQGAGNVAGEMRGQSFNESFSRRNAADRFNETNARRQQDVYDNNLRTHHANEDSRTAASRDMYSNERDTSDAQMGIHGYDRDREEEERKMARDRAYKHVDDGVKAATKAAGGGAPSLS